MEITLSIYFVVLTTAYFVRLIELIQNMYCKLGLIKSSPQNVYIASEGFPAIQTSHVKEPKCSESPLVYTGEFEILIRKRFTGEVFSFLVSLFKLAVFRSYFFTE